MKVGVVLIMKILNQSLDKLRDESNQLDIKLKENLSKIGYE